VIDCTKVGIAVEVREALHNTGTSDIAERTSREEEGLDFDKEE